MGKGDNIAEIIFSSATRAAIVFQDYDIVVISHTIVSRAEGRLVDLRTINPSAEALEIAEKTGKDARHVEVILRESKRILRVERGVIISESRHGIISANAGVDASNAGGVDYVITLPEDPDISAARIRQDLKRLTGKELAVIICDTSGRPFRRGTVNIAIGCSGINPLWDRRGEKDLFGRTLTSKITCVADEIASAAELVIGQADEGTPVALVRGYLFKPGEVPARAIIRPDEENLFK
ncbi:Coenzyme F420:L-glutamate ligase [archaeon HR01]|nr:Coenzyme F420:L-glutamate ligase [archaeon HR01]